jgi:hypothetical protein
MSSRSVTDVIALRKRRAFLSFHTCQDTKAKRELNPFRWQPCHSVRSCRQADSTEWFGWGRCFPSAVQMWNHSSRVNGQQLSMWSMDFGAWSQRKHSTYAWRSCLARRSLVQCFVLNASHRKIFTLSGAQIFQISAWPRKVMALVCNLLYADLATYCPSGVHRQTILSSWSRSATFSIAS